MTRFIRDIATALALLTRLPVPGADFQRGAQAAWAWPLVGVGVGGLAVLVTSGATWLGLTAPLAAGLALAAMIIPTGAMHEDGLADSADGLWGGWNRDKRLAIMRDSQIGTYGVLALVLVAGLRWIALTGLIASDTAWLILPAAILSRTAMVPLAHRLPHARDDGLSVTTGRPGSFTTFAALAVGVAAAIAAGGPGATLPALITCTILIFGVAAIAQAKIGGQTGDILGAAQQITETGVLLTLVTLAH